MDDEGLIDFQKKHFEFPLYRDESLSFYKLMGDRTLGVTGLLKLFTNFRMFRRLRQIGVEGNMVGEGTIQGGIIIFGKDGSPRAIYQEETGSELPLREIVSAMIKIRDEA